MAESYKGRRLSMEWSTFIFILLNIATCGIFLWIWMWKFIRSVSSPDTYASNKVLAIILLACYSWSYAVVSMALATDDLGLQMLAGIISSACDIATFVIVEVLSFKTAKNFENVLTQLGTPLKLNRFLLFIFPFYYQYYVAYNASEISAKQNAAHVKPAQASSTQQDDIAVKLEKLAILRDNNRITNEQFEAAKRKLLS